MCMPYAVGALDSSNENFASGKLTRLGFKRAVTVERKLDWDPETIRTFDEWWREARYAMPLDLRGAVLPRSQWVVLVFWDGIEDIDLEKAAKARSEELGTGQTSFPTIYAEKGLDYETEQKKQAKSLGLTLEEYRTRLANKLLPDVQSASQPPVKQGAANVDAE